MDEVEQPGRQPVPVPGAAGNVRLAASAQGGTVTQFGVVGGDVTVFNLPAVEPRRPGPPHQISSRDTCFHNRTAQLDAIDDVLLSRSADSVSLVILAGLPGIGRTALALAWVRRTLPANLFPGGELLVDYDEFRDRSGGDVAGALAECVRALGVGRELVGTTRSELAGQYRSVTAQREPLLVVLENVTEPAQVRPLLPNRPGSVVVVVGDRELGELVARDAAVLVRLGPLGPDGALELLSCAGDPDRVAADPAATARLIDLCGGLPLAVRIAAGRLRLDPHLSVADCVAELDDEAGRLAGFALGEESVLPLLLDRAVQRLSPSAAALYRTLGLMPVRTFSAQLIQVAARLPGRTAASTLRAIQEGTLLSQDDDGRYRMHDLVRLHARALAEEQGTAEQARDVLESVVSYYLPLAGFADRAVTGNRTRTVDLSALLHGLADPFADVAPGAAGAAARSTAGPGPRSRALAWLDAERPNLMTLLRAMVRDTGFDARASALAELLTALFLSRRYLTDWIESGTLGADAAARAGLAETEARLRSMLSRPLTDLGDLPRAGRELERALSLVEHSGNTVLRASVWEFQGRYLDAVDPAAAGAAYARSLELNLAAGERRGAALATFFLGENQATIGDARSALATLDRARARFGELTPPDERMGARADVARARALAALGRAAEAVADLDAAARVLAGLGAVYYEAGARELLGRLAADRGDRLAARENFGRALEIYQGAGDPRAAALRSLIDDLGADPDQASE